jgi:hypothetical protein
MTSETLEGILHLTTGERVRFASSDPAEVRSLVSQLMGGKLWSRPTLVVAEARHLTAIATSDITRADLSTHPEVEAAWQRFLAGGEDGASELAPAATGDASQHPITREEVLPEAYHEGASRMASQIVSRDDLVSKPGQSLEVFGRLSLRGGAAICLRYALAAPTAFEQRRFLANVFALSALPFRALPAFPDAAPGIAVLNPHAIASATFHPGATPTTDAWKVDAVYLETERGVAF